jgi:hypothetical protein
MAKYIVVDVESDGPIPGPYSMVCFGAVIVDNQLDKAFYGETKPISDKWDADSLAISGITRDQHLKFDDPPIIMNKFAEWINHNIPGQPIFISDNNSYDFAFINYYFHMFYGRNPFGWSSRRIGDLFCGFMNDSHYKWKRHRKTSHTHNPVDDAKSNAEALLYLRDQGFKIKF